MAESLSSPDPAVTPILLLEINKVPWRAIDRCVGDLELLRLNKFFRTAIHYTTLAVRRARMPPDSLTKDRRQIRADRIKDWLLAVTTEGQAKIPSLAELAS